MAFGLAGASTVIITSRTASELAEARAEIEARAANVVQVITHATDVTSEDSVKSLFDALAARNVVPDVLVANAGELAMTVRRASADNLPSRSGWTDKPTLTHEGDPAMWWRTWEINLKGTYLPTHYALKAAGARALTVICVSSIGSVMAMPGMGAYQGGKTAVNRFVEFVHAEYAAQGVRAFSIHPGNVITKLTDAVPPEHRHMFMYVGPTSDYIVLRMTFSSGIRNSWPVGCACGLWGRRRRIISGESMSVRLGMLKSSSPRLRRRATRRSASG